MSIAAPSFHLSPAEGTLRAKWLFAFLWPLTARFPTTVVEVSMSAVEVSLLRF